ncbi:hypothetical protein MLD38_024890 [Melastoma candidum]|uniref:Uncharacterized protein n=1 Tax=Melastoma candidum TaxID=119954 RepID=A0ACB9NV97_9MYRT|nr:hypothetical protein MLD38_024890 [Melastoma candidum]
MLHSYPPHLSSIEFIERREKNIRELNPQALDPVPQCVVSSVKRITVNNCDWMEEEPSAVEIKEKTWRKKEVTMTSVEKGDEEPQKLASLDVEDGENDSPIEEVRLTVPTKDDPNEPALTFRTWFLGIFSCVILAFVNQFFGYRQNPLFISSVSAQILVLPAGRLMARMLPTTKFSVPFTKWSFSLNPGPFNLKEHVLITIFANSGSGGVYALNIVTIIKAFYKKKISVLALFLLSQTTQMLGYGWAGLFRKYLVDSAYMWWPGNLVQVSLFTALHEKEGRRKGGVSRLQFFVIVFIASFSYYIFPGYLFQTLSNISIACLIWKNSVTAQQIGSGVRGLGIGSFGFDWSTIASFLGTPLAVPGFAIINILVGFVAIVYVLQPILYWSNAYDAKKYPFISSNTFDSTGQRFNITRVLNEKTFDLDIPAYNGYSKLYLSVFFAMTYGLSFATLSSSISHVMLFNGKTIVDMWKKTTSTLEGKVGDIHTRIMKKNYEEVPQWWFHVILVSMFALALWACEGFGRQLQLPWWGLLLACLMALLFTLPIGVIAATTNQAPGLNVITELVIGYLYPGRPLANVAFKTYGYISMIQALSFLGDFKLGHYMKIPPKSMFWVQLVGTVIASTVYFGTAWYLLSTIPDICDPDQKVWTCPGYDVFYDASIIWGVVGPGRMFTKDGVYPEMNWFFLIGFLAPFPVYFLSKKFPNHKWIRLIHMPVFLGATASMPPARSVNYITWGAMGLFFSFYVYKKHKAWWARYNYVLSAGLDAGLAFSGVLLYFALQSYEIWGPDWWGTQDGDHCLLARCPTAPGIKVGNCPVL